MEGSGVDVEEALRRAGRTGEQLQTQVLVSQTLSITMASPPQSCDSGHLLTQHLGFFPPKMIMAISSTLE